MAAPTPEKKKYVKPTKKEMIKATTIPGEKPVGYEKKTGMAIYTPEQLEKEKAKLPDPPTETALEEREKYISQVELLMLKGMTNVQLIARILGTPESSTYLYVKAVAVRWEVLGNPRKQNLAKGEAFAKLSKIEEELWGLYEKAPAKAISVKAMLLKQLMEIIERKLLIQGLSPRMLEQLSTDIIPEDQGAESPSELMKRHSNAVGVLTRILRTVDNESGEVEEQRVYDIEPEAE